MAQELERRFLIEQLPEVVLTSPALITLQGYFSDELRVRLVLKPGYIAGSPLTLEAIESATLTKKLETGDMLERTEYTSEVNPVIGFELFTLTGERFVEKVRYLYPAGGNSWEIDVFQGRHSGLIIAELEGTRESLTHIELLPFITREVTAEAAYRNYFLSLTPFPGGSHHD